MLKDKPVAELLNETHRVFRHAISEGIADNQPPAGMVEKLKNDVFVFSGCKTHIQLKELAGFLITPEGKVNSWHEFSRQAKGIYQEYNENYLKAEYVFATSSAQMASKWDDVSKDGDRYNLQYRTAGDNKVRDSHAVLRGTTLPASDSFWDSYYPPNGWRCRCTAVQVLKDKYPEDNSVDKIKLADQVTTQIDSKGRDRGAMFRFNPGKQQVIFPPNHPYYKVKENIGKIISGLQQNQPSEIKSKRRELVHWGKENLIDKTVHHNFEDIKSPITFSVTGIKEYLNQPHKHYIAKNHTIKRIPELIKNSKYVKSKMDSSGKQFRYHYLESAISGEKSYIVIREDLIRNTYVVYSNVDNLK